MGSWIAELIAKKCIISAYERFSYLRWTFFRIAGYLEDQFSVDYFSSGRFYRTAFAISSLRSVFGHAPVSLAVFDRWRSRTTRSTSSHPVGYRVVQIKILQTGNCYIVKTISHFIVKFICGFGIQLRTFISIYVHLYVCL